MTIVIRERVPEESSVGFQVSFEDEAGAALTPSAISWTLTNARGTVINSRSAVSVNPTASTVIITLSGDDLAWSSDPRRFLLVSATYSSDLGSNLPLLEQVQFSITNSAGV